MSQPPPLRFQHRCRVSVLEPEKIWTLRGDVLAVAAGEDAAEIAIPLASLTEVRLVFAPTRVQTNRFRCLLSTPAGRAATFQNEHFAGVLNFEDRSATYRELVAALVRRVAVANPSCRLEGGATWPGWLAQCALMLATGALLAVVLYFMGGNAGWIVIVKLAIIAFYLPVAFAWVNRNKPRPLSPTSIPEDLLPRS